MIYLKSREAHFIIAVTLSLVSIFSFIFMFEEYDRKELVIPGTGKTPEEMTSPIKKKANELRDILKKTRSDEQVLVYFLKEMSGVAYLKASIINAALREIKKRETNDPRLLELILQEMKECSRNVQGLSLEVAAIEQRVPEKKDESLKGHVSIKGFIGKKEEEK